MKFIIANWKCNPSSFKEARELWDAVNNELGDLNDTNIIICPPFVFSLELKREKSELKLGAQNCFWQQGAFTGEISAAMLYDIGSEYVLIGHSERERYFGETNSLIEKKLIAVLDIGLIPILCVGEGAESNNLQEIEKDLKKQLSVLKKIKSWSNAGFLIAYEPAWAIGSGKACDYGKAKESHLFIQKEVELIFNELNVKNQNIHYLYGGSVDSVNAADYFKAGYDGVLVGTSSLNPKEFKKIIGVIKRL